MDSLLEYLSFGFIKKFDQFLPMVLLQPCPIVKDYCLELIQNNTL